MNECLFFANDFPPIGGAGIQRPFYFAKYLPQFGWHPHVVTVKDVSFPVKDATLLDQLPQPVDVYRTESFELRRVLFRLQRFRKSTPPQSPAPPPAQDKTASNARVREFGRAVRRWLLVPDDRMLWLPFAVSQAMKIGRERPIRAVIATAPPYSAGVIGEIVSRRLGVPFILDLRDPWASDPYMPMPTRLHELVNRRLERSAVHAASAIVVISDAMAVALARDYPSVANKVSVITNGYDGAEFDSIEPAESEGYAVTYVGSLYAHHLDAVRVFREAWARATERDESFAASARFVVVGRVDPEIEEELRRGGSLPVTILGYMPHSRAVAYSKGASALFLIIKDLDPTRHVITIPGKLFEYLAAGPPILMIGPESDAAALVRSSGGCVHRQSDVEGVAASMLALFKAYNPAAPRPVPRGDFDRRVLTRRLAGILDSVTGSPAAASSER